MKHTLFTRCLGWGNHNLAGKAENFKPLTWYQYNALCDKIENLDKKV